MDHDRLHRRARDQGANPIIYAIVRMVLQPFFRIYFRMQRIGREHIPSSGSVIIAANHHSMDRRRWSRGASSRMSGRRL
jgi:glycerol-3-phosphate dehydrogenase (NAD(P)+)